MNKGRMVRRESGDTILERIDFYSIPEPNSGCYLWFGSFDGKGYGRLFARRKMRRVPRLLWIEINGPIPPGLIVRHKCDMRACVNLDHLCLGTIADNNNDRDIRGRHVALRGESNGFAKITSDLAVKIFIASGRYQNVAWKFDVSWSLVQAIKSGRLWKEATQPYWSETWRNELELRKRARQRLRAP